MWSKDDLFDGVEWLMNTNSGLTLASLRYMQAKATLSFIAIMLLDSSFWKEK